MGHAWFLVRRLHRLEQPGLFGKFLASGKPKKDTRSWTRSNEWYLRLIPGLHTYNQCTSSQETHNPGIHYSLLGSIDLFESCIFWVLSDSMEIASSCGRGDFSFRMSHLNFFFLYNHTRNHELFLKNQGCWICSENLWWENRNQRQYYLLTILYMPGICVEMHVCYLTS